jgi:hypothetical protein
MRKQMLKGLTMMLGIMTLALATAVVTAQGQTLSARATVPFAFEVGDRILPAGDYQLNTISASGAVVRIQGSDSQNVALGMTRETAGIAKQAQLVFHRFGERYFLAEVWSGPESGRVLSASRQERALRKELSRIAANKPAQRAYETVEIAIALR